MPRNDHKSVPSNASVTIRLTAGNDSISEAPISFQYDATTEPSLKASEMYEAKLDAAKARTRPTATGTRATTDNTDVVANTRTRHRRLCCWRR